MNKYTPWFSDDILPTRVGLYEVEFFIPHKRKSKWYAYFDGKEWGWMSESIRAALNFYKTEEHHEKLCWRGLSQNPKNHKQAEEL